MKVYKKNKRSFWEEREFSQRLNALGWSQTFLLNRRLYKVSFDKSSIEAIYTILIGGIESELEAPFQPEMFILFPRSRMSIVSLYTSSVLMQHF